MRKGLAPTEAKPTLLSAGGVSGEGKACPTKRAPGLL